MQNPEDKSGDYTGSPKSSKPKKRVSEDNNEKGSYLSFIKKDNAVIFIALGVMAIGGVLLNIYSEYRNAKISKAKKQAIEGQRLQIIALEERLSNMQKQLETNQMLPKSEPIVEQNIEEPKKETNDKKHHKKAKTQTHKKQKKTKTGEAKTVQEDEAQEEEKTEKTVEPKNSSDDGTI